MGDADDDKKTSGDDVPYGYIFQHVNTGLQQVVYAQQVEWGFEKNNPLWEMVGPVYLHPMDRKEERIRSRMISNTDDDLVSKMAKAIGDGISSCFDGHEGVAAEIAESVFSVVRDHCYIPEEYHVFVTEFSSNAGPTFSHVEDEKGNWIRGWKWLQVDDDCYKFVLPCRKYVGRDT